MTSRWGARNEENPKLACKAASNVRGEALLGVEVLEDDDDDEGRVVVVVLTGVLVDWKLPNAAADDEDGISTALPLLPLPSLLLLLLSLLLLLLSVQVCSCTTSNVFKNAFITSVDPAFAVPDDVCLAFLAAGAAGRMLSEGILSMLPNGLVYI